MKMLTEIKMLRLTPYMLARLKLAVKKKYNSNLNEAIRDGIRDYLLEINCWIEKEG